mmetsp:Transcript_14746/g.43267  ORF Transcript_14746/g.43267 Transcript_14746/m.43267 type:complete len:468 (+) Transcript_14746:176-1579(+)
MCRPCALQLAWCGTIRRALPCQHAGLRLHTHSCAHRRARRRRPCCRLQVQVGHVSPLLGFALVPILASEPPHKALLLHLPHERARLGLWVLQRSFVMVVAVLLNKPQRTVGLASLLELLPRDALLLFQPQLLGRRTRELAQLERALIRAEARVARRQVRHARVAGVVEADGKCREVVLDFVVLGVWTLGPHHDGVGRPTAPRRRVLGLLRNHFVHCGAGQLVHLPVVAIKHRALKLPAPLQLAAARLEREDCLVAGFLALHLDLSIQLRPVVPKDEIIDTDGGPVPAVLLATAVELERLAAVHDQLDRLAPELGLDLKLSLRFPRMRLPDAAGCVVRRHRRVVADLLAQVPHVALWRAPLVCLAKQRVEWLALTQRLRVVARQLPHSHKHHARDRVGRRRRRIHERHVLKRLSEALQEVERLVDGGRHRDACEVLRYVGVWRERGEGVYWVWGVGRAYVSSGGRASA